MNFLQLADEYIQKNPFKLISHVDYEEGTFWIKRRPLSKKTKWHQLNSLLSYIIPIATFSPTVATNQSNSLVQEAKRLCLFASKGLPVPEVLASTPHYLITNDVGPNLQQLLEQITDSEERAILLKKAMDLLLDVHLADLCHGRPALRDMTLKNGKVYLIDLEENPLEVMSLAQAQARDIWLFFSSLARHCNKDYQILEKLFLIYLKRASPATLSALKQMVFFLKPLRIFCEYLLAPVKSKDLRNAVKANKVLENGLKYSLQAIVLTEKSKGI